MCNKSCTDDDADGDKRIPLIFKKSKYNQWLFIVNDRFISMNTSQNAFIIQSPYSSQLQQLFISF